MYDETLADLFYFDKVRDVIRVSWSPDSNMLATLTNDSTLQIWQVMLEPYSLTLHQSWTFDSAQDHFLFWFSWSPDSEELAVITGNGTQILDVTTGDMDTKYP